MSAVRPKTLLPVCLFFLVLVPIPGISGTIGTADVSVAKTLLTAGPYHPGQTVFFQIAVSNGGPDVATNILVTDTPTNLTINSVMGGGCSSFPCTIPDLSSTGTVNLVVNATIQSAGPFDNGTTVSAMEIDPNTNNNQDLSGNGGVAVSADVTLTKTLTTAGPFTAGQSINYMINVGNSGPPAATNVLVSDIPTNLTITSVSGGGCSAFPCTIPNIPSGVSIPIGVTATIIAAGPFDNSAMAAANEFDPNFSNNNDLSGNGGTAGATLAGAPTLSEWALILMALMLAVAGVYFVKM